MDKIKLKDHTKNNGTLETPFTTGILGQNLHLTSWFKEALPELFWIALIFYKYGRTESMNLFERITKDLENIQLCESRFSKILSFPESKQKPFFDVIDNYVGRSVLAPLTLICKDSYFYRRYVNPSISVDDKINMILTICKECIAITNNISTDICFISLRFLMSAKKICMHKDVNYLADILANYAYCTHADPIMHSYRPIVRATYQGFSHNINDNSDNSFSYNFWNTLAEITPCKLYSIKYQRKEPSMTFFDDINKTMKYIETHCTELKTSAKHVVILSITTYIIKIYREIIEKNLLETISGRILFRTMIEGYFNLRFLQFNESKKSNIFEDFIEYGLGKYKLITAKIREGKFMLPESAHINHQILELYVNEEKNENFLNIDLKYFDKTNIREKARIIGEEYLYEIYYEYDTNFTHALWGAIRESATLCCANPSHVHHAIPDFYAIQPLCNINDDCEYLIKKLMCAIASDINLPDFYKLKYIEEKND